MVAGLDILAPGLFALGGVAVGAWLNTRSETSRWRREFEISRIAVLREHFADIIEATDLQVRLCSHVAAQIKGQGDPVTPERIEATGTQWARVMARKSVEAPANVQNAVVAFDVARNRFANVVNARDVGRIDAAMGEVDAARREILLAMNVVLESMRQAQAVHMLPARVRWWRRLRGRPLIESEGA